MPMFHRTCCVGAIFALAGLASAALAAPVFGPVTLELTEGETQLYVESFEAESAGPFVLFVSNGDGECARVVSAAIDLNGSPVVTAGDLDEDTRQVVRRVMVQAGPNELAVELAGRPGSFVTVVVLPPGEAPVFVAGRLVLPWGRDDDSHILALALNNDSRDAPRVFRVLFYRPDGHLVAATERLPLPPRGSIAFTVEEAISAGDWTVGSVEVVYAGRGPGRLFGTARQFFPAPIQQTETQSLVQAGFHLVDRLPRPLASPSRRRP
jgi:hypothetical protein